MRILSKRKRYQPFDQYLSFYLCNATNVLSFIILPYPPVALSAAVFFIFTKLLYNTLIAFRISGNAAVSSMVDQTVMSFGPSVLRKHLHQSQLCFKNIFLFYKPYSVCKSEDMSIHCYPLMSETYRQHHISGFSSPGSFISSS